jgi:hypothetical protein
MTGKKLVVVAALLVLVLSTAGIAGAVTNGQPDGDDHPYVGLLVFDVFDPDEGENVPAWRCSGALIAPDVVLTAGHCTEGAVAARVWFDERLQDDDGSYLVNDYPWGGGDSIEGTPYLNPGYDGECGPGNGLPGFACRDVGIVVLDEVVDVGGMAVLPEAGLVDTLKNKTDIDFVGYGVTDEHRGGGPPFWMGLKNRLYAPSKLVSGKFVHSAEFMRLSLNASQGKGGTCFGDSGGPDLLAGTDTVLAVNSYVTNYNCAGVGYSGRVDIPEVLDWINGFLP